MKPILASLFICLIASVNYSQIQSTKEEKLSNGCQWDIKVIIEVYENSAKIIVPQDLDPHTNIRIPVFYYDNTHNIRVLVDVQYKSNHTNLGYLKLEMQGPHTTLVPVKIPPTSSNISRNNSQKNQCNFVKDIFGTYSITKDTYTSVRFKLKKCQLENGSCYSTTPLSGNIIDSNSATYEAYITPLPDLVPRNLYFDFDDEQRLTFNALIENQSIRPSTGRKTVKIYSSKDRYLDTSDILQKTIYLNYLGGFPNNTSQYSLFYNDFNDPYIDSNYLLVNIENNDNHLTDSDVSNNLASKLQSKDLSISDARVYRHSNQHIALSCTISNTGNVASPPVKVNFKEERGYRREIYEQTVPKLLPGESKVVTTYVTPYEYSIYLNLNTLVFSVDRNNTITELDETNNQKKLRLLGSVNGSQNFVTVSPNPFSYHGIDFDFPISSINTDVKIHIYDHSGVLKYQTSKFYTSTGDKTIHVSSNYLSNQGVYHYSFLIGRFGRYISFTGTIIKQ